MLLQEVQELVVQQVVQDHQDHLLVLGQVVLQDHLVTLMEVLDLLDQQVLVDHQDHLVILMEVLDQVVHQVLIQLFMNMQLLLLILVVEINFM